MCDGSRMLVEDDRPHLTEDRLCGLGRRWLDAAVAPVPDEARVAGQPVDLATALNAARRLLNEARRPLLIGLEHASNAAVQRACEIAAARDGLVLGPPVAFSELHRTGLVTATLGEVRQRCDVLVRWGDLDASHPHWRQRLLDPSRPPAATIVLGGTAVADPRDAAVEHWPLTSAQREPAVMALHAALAGVPLDPSRVEHETGWSRDAWRQLAQRLQAARFGVWLTGSLGLAGLSPAARRGLLACLAQLNESTRFALMGLAGGGNPVGAAEVLAARTAATEAVRFVQGQPEPLEHHAAVALVVEGRFDLAVLLGGRWPLGLPTRAADALRGRKLIVLGGPSPSVPLADGTRLDPAVWLACQPLGPTQPGTVARSDGVYLPLRPILRPSAASLAERLGQLASP